MAEKGEKTKRPGAHRPRDADDVSDQNDRRVRQKSRRKYQNRGHTDNPDGGRGFHTKDDTFSDSGTFGEEKKAETSGSKKLHRMQGKAEKAGKKAAAEKSRLPKKTAFSIERVFDEKTGRAK